MNFWLANVVTLIYAYVCLERLFAGDYKMALAYAGWAVANVGITLTLKP